MANLGNTIVNGALRVNGKINSSDVISAPSFVGALTGNADTATKLKTARTINGVSFDGSANITVADSTKLPLTGGTLSGDLNFSHAGSEHPASIGWNTGTIRQRIRIFDEGATDNNVFEFQQSKDSGSTYTTLMAITADNKVKATTFVGALSGNATSASKLKSAQTITVTGDLSGSVSFDGSEAKSFSVYNYNCSVNGGNKANYPYHRFAYVTGKTGTYTDTDGIFDIRGGYNGGAYGRIKISLRTNNNNSNCDISARWLFRNGISEDTVTIAQWGKTRRGSLCRCIC